MEMQRNAGEVVGFIITVIQGRHSLQVEIRQLQVRNTELRTFIA